MTLTFELNYTSKMDDKVRVSHHAKYLVKGHSIEKSRWTDTDRTNCSVWITNKWSITSRLTSTLQLNEAVYKTCHSFPADGATNCFRLWLDRFGF